MPGQALHQLDAFLCRHARDNVCWNLNYPEIAQRVDQLDPRLCAFVRAGYPDLGDVPPTGQFLVSELEFDLLIEAVSGLPATIVHDISDQPDALWQSDAAFFTNRPMCTAEVRQHLSAAEAERWSEQCNALIRKLTDGQLRLSHGLDAARELAVLIRQYLTAMGELTLIPPPRGSFPTPMNPLPAVDNVEGQLDAKLKAAVQRMRTAVMQHPRGSEATPRALIKEANINNALGRQALRILEALGEYRGFGKSTAE